MEEFLPVFKKFQYFVFYRKRVTVQKIDIKTVKATL